MQAMKEADAREFAEKYFRAALEEEDLDVYVNLYLNDGVLEDPAGTPPVRGKEAIREFVRKGREHIESSRATIHAAIACGDEVAVHWSIEVRSRRGENVTIHGIGIFTLGELGKLSHVKEYYDASLLAQLAGGGSGAAE